MSGGAGKFFAVAFNAALIQTTCAIGIGGRTIGDHTGIDIVALCFTALAGVASPVTLALGAGVVFYHYAKAIFTDEACLAISEGTLGVAGVGGGIIADNLLARTLMTDVAAGA